jgi:hypothetical protein
VRLGETKKEYPEKSGKTPSSPSTPSNPEKTSRNNSETVTKNPKLLPKELRRFPGNSKGRSTIFA